MKQKGFTLIELLAVIVILAIIALIAIPNITKVVEEARKGAAKSSALGYIDAVEKYVLLHGVNPTKYPYDLKGKTMNVAENHETGFLDLFISRVYAESETPILNNIITVNGEKPKSGTVTVNNQGKVTEAELLINKYNVIYDGREAKIGSENSENNNTPKVVFNGVIDKSDIYSSTNVKQLGVKGVVYLDPTDLSATCNASNSVSTTGTKTGCMKFYIFDDSSDNYKMILDHNTTATVAWNSNDSNASMGEVATALSNDTTEWVGNPRLITADEVATIIGNTSFDSATSLWDQWFYLDSNGQTQTVGGQGSSKYAWLFDYTYSCKSSGCNLTEDSTSGYWTSSPVVGHSDSVWDVRNSGSMQYLSADYNSHFGVRPVIEVSKSIING